LGSADTYSVAGFASRFFDIETGVRSRPSSSRAMPMVVR
jgi:hypothetical protein